MMSAHNNRAQSMTQYSWKCQRQMPLHISPVNPATALSTDTQYSNKHTWWWHSATSSQ